MMPVSRNDMVAEEKGRRARERKEMTKKKKNAQEQLNHPSPKITINSLTRTIGNQKESE